MGEQNLSNRKIHVIATISYSFEENSYIIYSAEEKETEQQPETEQKESEQEKPCVVVDPGIDPDTLLGTLHEQKLTPIAILITHGHFDHIAGIPDVQRIWPNAQIWTSRDESEKLTDPQLNLSGMFGFPRTVPAADRIIEDSEEFSVAGLDFQALLIPGHSKGHLVYVLKNVEPKEIFVGDTVFRDSIGRGDFFDGNSIELVETIKEKIFPFPDDTILYPGHGPKTTVGREKKHNPYLQ